MGLNKFEISISLGIFIGWLQLMFGFTSHAFYSLGLMMVIILMGILGYLRMIYLDK